MTWLRTLPFAALIIWISLLFGLNRHTCTLQLQYSMWTKQIDFGSGCCFFANLLRQLWQLPGIWKSKKSSRIVLHLSVSAISVIAGTSNFLQYFELGNICEDAMGFALPLTLWLEWMICVPLMAFIAIFFDEDQHILRSDGAFVSLLFLCIFFGFCTILVQPLWAYTLFLVGSFATFLGSACIVMAQTSSGHRILDTLDIDQNGKDQLRKHLNQAAKAKKLNRLLILVLPPFPIIFMLGTFRILSLDWTYAALLIANFLAKYIFLSVASDINIDMVDKLVSQLHAGQVLNESRQRYLRYVFHEVRVPLNSLSLGLTMFADKQGISLVDKEALEMMEDATNYMTDTVNDMLSMSQIEEGKMELRRQRVSPRALLKRACALVRSISDASGTSVVLKVDGSIPQIVLADKFRLENALVNVLTYAIKASPRNTPIEIRAKADERTCGNNSINNGNSSSNNSGNNNRNNSGNNNATIHGHRFTLITSTAPVVFLCTISVRDRGDGMTPSEIRDLFTPFQHIRPDAVQQRNGTGMGMFLARSVVELHGGTLDCESTSDLGTTFTIRLPLVVVDVDAGDSAELRTPSPVNRTRPVFFSTPSENAVIDETKKFCAVPFPAMDSRTVSPHSFDESPSSVPPVVGSAVVPAEGPGPDRGSVSGCAPMGDACGERVLAATKEITCLIVDDTASNRKMLAFALKGKNFDPHFAVDGAEGVNRVRTDPDRFDIIFMDFTMPIMNGVEATRVIRSEGFTNLVIGVTGNALDDDVEAFLAAGADLVLAKPVRAHQLEALLSHIASNGCASTGSELILDSA